MYHLVARMWGGWKAEAMRFLSVCCVSSVCEWWDRCGWGKVSYHGLSGLRRESRCQKDTELCPKDVTCPRMNPKDVCKKVPSQSLSVQSQMADLSQTPIPMA